MPWRSVGWASAALIFTGLAWAQGGVPEAADTWDSRLIRLWLMWALVWVLLAAGLCIALFKLYSYWPGAERWLVPATLVALPPVSTVLTTSHVPLLGWLLPRDGGIEYASIFAFWVVVALGFGAAWRFVKTRTSWLKSPSEPPAASSFARSYDPDSTATRTTDEASARPHTKPTPKATSMGSGLGAEPRADASATTPVHAAPASQRGRSRAGTLIRAETGNQARCDRQHLHFLPPPGQRRCHRSDLRPPDTALRPRASVQGCGLHPSGRRLSRASWRRGGALQFVARRHWPAVADRWWTQRSSAGRCGRFRAHRDRSRARPQHPGHTATSERRRVAYRARVAAKPCSNHVPKRHCRAA